MNPVYRLLESRQKAFLMCLLLSLVFIPGGVFAQAPGTAPAVEEAAHSETSPSPASSPAPIQRGADNNIGLAPVPEAVPTIEERVDSIFGVIVQHMVTVLFWDVVFWDNGETMQPNDALGSGVRVTRVDPLGWGVAALSQGGGAYFKRNGEKIASYEYEGLPSSAMFTADGMTLYVGTDRGELLEFDRKGGKGKPVLQTRGALNQLVLNGAGTHALLAGLDGQVSLLDVASKSIEMVTLHKGGINSMSFRSDGQYAVIASQDGRTNVVEFTDAGVAVKAVMANPGPVLHASFTGAGETEVLTVAADGTVVVQGVEPARTWTLGIPVEQVWAAGNTMVAQGPKGVRTLDLSNTEASGAELTNVPQKGFGEVFFSGNGFYGLGAGGELWLYSAASGDGSWSKADFGSVAGGPSNQGIHQDRKGVLYVQSGGVLTAFTDKRISLPFVVFWLAFGAVFFTWRMGFVNFRMFKHAIEVVRGTYDNPDDEGEVTHFQALTSALSATVGLGNIAGVAIAVSIGGPGATFWMIMTGLLGMASKFAECTLGQKYRTVNADGEVMGGAMHYLSKGLGELNMPKFGKGLAIVFAILCVGASFGGGNSFQVKQSLGVLAETFPVFAEYNWLYGLIMMILVGIVILGGIQRIAQTAEKVVPAMCGIYVAACLYVILANVGSVGAAFGAIFEGAFAPDALYGGLVGVLVVGVTRAAFSNEAGIGSAAIAHAAAKTEYPVREGVVALLEPFIDTVVVCTMTALVIVITGAYENPDYGTIIAAKEGAQLTSLAMGEEISWFPYVLSVAVVLFAYSTMISWSYYGERCWTWLFGPKSTLYYRLLFLVFVFLGSIMTASNILDFSDLMILGMAIPNVLGVMLLSRGVRADLDDYVGKLQRGEMKRWK